MRDWSETLRHTIAAFDRKFAIFCIILVASLALGVQIKLNLNPNSPTKVQLGQLNPDARLYYSLAKNLSDGTGYHDTFRNSQTLPSIGHPLILAIGSFYFGLSPARLSWLSICLSIAMLALAARLYCRSNILVLGMVGIYTAFLGQVRWLSGNVEPSIALAISLLILCLSVFYRSNFAIASAIASGVALAIVLLVRPIYLYPMHAASFLVLTAVAYHHVRKRPRPIPRPLRGWKSRTCWPRTW